MQSLLVLRRTRHGHGGIPIRAVPVQDFRARRLNFDMCLKMHSYQLYFEAEHKTARAKAVQRRREDFVATLPQGTGYMYRNTARTTYIQRALSEVWRGRRGARGPSALRRRAAGCAARRQQPTRRRSAPTQTCPDPRTRLHKCGEMRVSTPPKSPPKSPKPPPRSSKSPDHQRVHHTRWWGVAPDANNPPRQPTISRPLWEGSKPTSLEAPATLLVSSAEISRRLCHRTQRSIAQSAASTRPSGQLQHATCQAAIPQRNTCYTCLLPLHKRHRCAALHERRSAKHELEVAPCMLRCSYYAHCRVQPTSNFMASAQASTVHGQWGLAARVPVTRQTLVCVLSHPARGEPARQPTPNTAAP